MLLAFSRTHGNLGVKWLDVGVRLGAVNLRILGPVRLVLGFGDLAHPLHRPVFLVLLLAVVAPYLEQGCSRAYLLVLQKIAQRYMNAFAE